MPIFQHTRRLAEDDQKEKNQRVNAIGTAIAAPSVSAPRANQATEPVQSTASAAPTVSPVQPISQPRQQTVSSQPAQAQEQTYKINEESPWAGMAVSMLSGDRAGLDTEFNRLHTPGDSLYTPYITATNVDALTSFGQLVGEDFSNGISADRYDFWANNFESLGLERNADGKYTSPNTVYGTSKNAKASAAYKLQQTAYLFNDVMAAEKNTRAAEDEYQKLQEQIDYWVGRTDLNLSDQDIIDRLDRSGYKTLNGMDTNAAAGGGTRLNRSVTYSDGLISGMIWKSRNKDQDTGNAVYNAVYAAAGIGNQWQYDENINKYLAVGTDDYNPYKVMSTLDDMCQKYKVTEFDREWLNAHGQEMARTEQGKKDYAKIEAAIDFTEKCEAEAAGLRDWIAYQVENGGTVNFDDPDGDDYIFGSKLTYLDKNGNTVEVKPAELKKLQGSLENKGFDGKLVDTSGKIDFDLDELKHEYAAKKNETPEFSEAFAEVFGGTESFSTSDMVDAAMDKAMGKWRNVLLEYGTLDDKDLVETLGTLTDPDKSAAFVEQYVNAGLLSKDDAAQLNYRVTEEYAAKNYMSSVWNVGQYDNAKRRVDEKTAELKATYGVDYDPNRNPDQTLESFGGFVNGLLDTLDYDGAIERGEYKPLPNPVFESANLAGTWEDQRAFLEQAYKNGDLPEVVLEQINQAVWMANNGAAGSFVDTLERYDREQKINKLNGEIRIAQRTVDEYAPYYEDGKNAIDKIVKGMEDAATYTEGIYGTPVRLDNGMDNYSAHMIDFGFERVDSMVGAMDYVLKFGGRDFQAEAPMAATRYSLLLENSSMDVRKEMAERHGVAVEDYTDQMAKEDALDYLLSSQKWYREQLEQVERAEQLIETYGLNVEGVGSMVGEKNMPYENFLKYADDVRGAVAYFDNMALKWNADFDRTVKDYVEKQYGGMTVQQAQSLPTTDEGKMAAQALLAISGGSGKLPEDLDWDKGQLKNIDMHMGMVKNYASGEDARNRLSAEDGKTVLYLLGQGKTEEAREFFDFVNYSGYGTMRNASVQSSQYKEFANEMPVLSSAATIAASPLQAGGVVYAAVQGIRGEEIDPNNEIFTPNRFVNTVRGQVGQNIEETYGSLARFFYDTSMSGGDSLVNCVLTGGIMGGFGLTSGFLGGHASTKTFSAIGKMLGDFASASLMGAEAASTAVWNAKLNNASNEQALLMGGATFLCETLTEAVTVENIGKIFSTNGAVEGLETSFKDILRNTLKSVAPEAASEIMAEIGEKRLDALFMGEDSEWDQLVTHYVSMGYSENTARQKALGDFAHDVFLAGVGGALMAGEMGAVSMIKSGMRTSIGNIWYGRDVNATRQLNIQGAAIQQNVTSLEGQLKEAQQKAQNNNSKRNQARVTYLESLVRDAKAQETKWQGTMMELLDHNLSRGTQAIAEIQQEQDAVEAERHARAQENEQALANAGMGAMQTVNADTAAQPLTLETISDQIEEAETRMSEAKVSAAEAEATAQAEADQTAESAEKQAQEAREKALAKLQRQTDKIIQNANQRRNAAIQAANKLTGEEKQKAIDTANRRAETTIKGANTRLQNGTADIENQLQTQLEYIANQRDASYQNAAEVRRTAEAEADRILEETRFNLNQQREQAQAEQERTRETAEAQARKNGAAQVEANAKAEADRIAKETTEALARQNFDDRDSIEARRAATIKSINENKSLNDHARARSRERANARFDRMQERVEAEYQQKIKAVQDEKNDAYARAEADRSQTEAEADEILKRSAVPANPNAAMAPVNPEGVQQAPAAIVQQEAQATDALNGIQADMEKFQQLVDGLAHQMTSGDQEAVNAALAQLRQVSGDTNALINVIKAGLQRQVDETQTSPNAERMAQVRALDEVYKRMQALIDFMGEGEATATAETQGQEAQPIPETEGNPVPTGGTIGEMEAPALEENAGPSEEMVEQEQPAPMQDVPAPAAEETMDQAEEDNEDKSLIDFVNDFKNAVGNALDTIRGALTYARDNSAEAAKTDAENAARAKVLDLYSGMKDLIDQMKGWYATYQAGLKKKDNAKADRAQTEFGNLFKQLQEMWKNYVDATGTNAMNSAGLDANGNLLGNTNGIPGAETGNQSADPVATAIAVLNRAQSTGNRGTQFAATQAVMNNRNEGNTDTVAIARAGAATQSMFSLFGTDGTIQGLKHVFGSAFVNGMDMSGVRGAITTLALTGEQGSSVLRQLFEGRMDLPSAITSAAQIAGQNVNAAILQKKVEAYQTGIEMRRLIGQGGLESTLGAQNNLRTANQNLEAAENELDAKIQDRENRYNELQDAMAEYDRASGMQERAPNQGGNANSGKQNALKDAAAAVAAASQSYGNAMSVVAEYQQKVNNARQAQRNAQKQYDDAVNGAMGKLRTQALANVRQANAENTTRLAEEKAARDAQAAEAVAQAEQNVRDVADAARAEAVRTLAEAEQGRAERAAGNAENAERTGEAQNNSNEQTDTLGGERAELGGEARMGMNPATDAAPITGAPKGAPKKSPFTIARDLAGKLGIGEWIASRKMNRVPKTVAGYYNIHARYVAVRPSEAGSYGITMHELGHAIQERLGIESTDAMVATLKADPCGLAVDKYSLAEQKKEAFAEFFWRYAESEQRGVDFAGRDFVEQFDEALREGGIYDDVYEAIEGIRAWVEAGVGERIDPMVHELSERRKNPGLRQRFRSLVASFTDKTSAAEELNHVLRQARGTRKLDVFGDVRAMSLLRQTAGKVAYHNLTHALTDSRRTRIGKSLAERFEEAGLKNADIKQWENYMLALHSVARDAQHKPVFDNELLTPEKRQAWIAEMDSQHPEFRKAADAFEAFRREFMQAWLVDTGFLSQDAFDAMNKMYPYYVPTQRVKADKKSDEGRPNGSSQTYRVMRATGSTEDFWSPLDTFVSNVNRIVNMVTANNAALAWDNAYQTTEGLGVFGREVTSDMEKQTVDTKALQNQVRKLLDGNVNGDLMDEIIKLIGEEQVQFRSKDGTTMQNSIGVQLPDGSKRFYQMQDMELYRLLSGYSAVSQNTNEFFGKIATATKIMSALTTGSNPVFALRNFLRDFQTSVNYGSWASNYITGAGKWLAAFWDVWKNGSPLLEKFGVNPQSAFDDYLAMGGGGYSRIEADTKKGAREYREALVSDGANTKNVGAFGRFAGKKLWAATTLERLNEIIEQTSRYAEYKYGKHDKTTAEGRTEAYLAAQDVTVDFGRSGYGTAAKAMKAFVPFFNASMQGVYRTGRMFTEAERDRLPARFLKTVLNTGILSALCAMALKAGLDDDEKKEFVNMSYQLKAGHFYLPNIAPDVFGDVPLIRIPIGQDPLMVAVHGLTTMGMWSGNPDGTVLSLAAIADGIVNNLNPIGSTIVDPIVGIMSNQSWYGSPITPTRYDGMGYEVQYSEDIPDIFVDMSHSPANVFHLNAFQIQYLVQQYTGFLGQMAVPAMTKENGKIGGLGAALNAARQRFTSDPLKSSEATSAFYDARAFLTEIGKDYKAKKLGDVFKGMSEKDQEKCASQADALSKGIVKTTYYYIVDANQRIDRINANTTLTDHEKYVQTTDIRREMQKRILLANEKIGAFYDTWVRPKSLLNMLIFGDDYLEKYPILK